MHQRIHIARTPDDVCLAWTRSGPTEGRRGPTLVKASNWLTHVRRDPDSPVWGHWLAFLGGHFDYVRFDERGCGQSDRDVEDVSERHWLGDLETVVAAADIRRPFVLLGVSQGAAASIQFAIAHPERVSHLVLYGGYAVGAAARGGRSEEHFRAILEMARLGWGRDNPLFRQVFTGRFVPRGTHEQLDWFNDLCRDTVAPEMAVRVLEARSRMQIADLLPRVRVPTLVLHARHDEVVPFAEGRRLASEIPGAEFVELDSHNHVLLAHEPAWAEFQRAVLAFTGLDADADAVAHEAQLTPRERQILGLLDDGLSNAEIGRRVFLSEKTVRNHQSSIYRKLGVANRAQAIVRHRIAGDAHA
jgi:pimeloyl-ACP methyl ester carboxylesterase/DNA-binding CsgD family transcriptional regulator